MGIRSTLLPELTFKTSRKSVSLPGLTLELETLDSLEDTIDHVFEHSSQQSPPIPDETLLAEYAPYFGILWPSARALTEHLLAHRESLLPPGHSFLELGCGLALPSLALALSGSEGVATDSHAEVGGFLNRNLEHNAGAKSRLSYRRASFDLIADAAATSKLVFGSDILYEKEQPRKLRNALMLCFECGAETFILADPGRPYLQTFVSLMEEAGLKAETVVARDIFLITFKAGVFSDRLLNSNP